MNNSRFYISEFRQDMGGVGGFIRENKTLYVGRIAITDDTEEVVKRQFGQFGPLDRVRVLKNRGVAFVTYKTRANAEFAREAMMNQCLENNEIINVRWATADPNAIANRLDAEDDRLEAERLAQEQALLEEGDESQNVESELPAEFTTLKRDVDEDGFTEMESRVKRQRAEEEAAAQQAQIQDAVAADSTYEYTQEDYDLYYQQQQEYYQQQLAQQKEEEQKNSKVAGIIPQNVLANLKTLSKNTPIKTNTTANTKTTTGLGNLADYGSDSEDED
jgi:RNA recognition motif-containing protein